MSSFLIVTASATFLVAFFVYNRDFIHGRGMPVFAPWPVFSLIVAVNCVSSLQFAPDPLNVLVFVTDLFICVAMTVIIAVKMKFKVKVDKVDQWIMLVSLVCVLVWVLTKLVITGDKSAMVGNLMNQVPYTLAFWSIYRNVRRDPKSEPTVPWLLWTIAFVLNIIALELKGGATWVDYVSPVVCLFHHGAIAALSLRNRVSQADTAASENANLEETA